MKAVDYRVFTTAASLVTAAAAVAALAISLSRSRTRQSLAPLVLQEWNAVLVAAGYPCPPLLVLRRGGVLAETNGLEVRVGLRPMQNAGRRFCGSVGCVRAMVAGVLAHELAHCELGHARAHEGTRAEGREMEEASDRRAGEILAALNYPPEPLQRLLADGAHACPVPRHGTHPCSDDRVAAVAEGYMTAKNRERTTT